MPFVVPRLRARTKNKIYEIDKEIPQKVIIPEILSIEERDILKSITKMCDRGLMKIIGDIPTCTQRIYPYGIQRQEYFIHKEPHPKRGEIMNRSDIIEICDACKQEFTEDERIKKLYNVFTDDTITTYFCNHPEIREGGDIYTSFPWAKFPCPKENRNVRIDRTCKKEPPCEFLEIEVREKPLIFS